jgi:hypothetical protein
MSELIIDKITTRDGSNVGAIVVADIDELLLLNTNKEINTTAIVKDNNRGGVFIYDGAQSGVNNGGTIFNGWVRQYDGAVNVKWFGAVDEGILPSNTGAQNKTAIDAALASLGDNVLYFPAGTYVTDGYHNIVNKRIKGDGNTSIIQLSGTNTYDVLFKNNPDNLSEAGGWGSGGSGIYLKDIKLKGNWDGASDQVTITPPSGNGNGIVGLRYADYNIDTNKAVLQLISSTRVYMDGVGISHGYGHNMILYRCGYSHIKQCGFSATRGSGIYSPNPSASDTVTSTPIESCSFETCRGEYGGIYAQYWSGTSITNTVFEAQPYGMYMDEMIDVVTTGNYGESHYYEDFYISPTTWGLVDMGNYAFGQTKPVSPYKGILHYRRDSGFFVDTDNTTYGTRDAQINGKYIQRGHTSHGGLQTISSTLVESGDYFNKQLAYPGFGSLGFYSVLRHQHNANSLSGASEIRFKRNLNQNSWSGLGFACGRGALVEYLSIGDTGHTTPGTDNTQTLGSASNRWSVVYAGTGTINTSDDREKTYIDITETEKLVALELKANMRKFKFNDAIENKGVDNARIHFGASAQTVKSIFEKHGLVAEDYAILCYDEWEEQQEAKDEEGTITQEFRVAGNRYGLRYEELLSFIIGAM